MSKATFTFGRFNPPSEAGHGKLVSAVKDHAEKSGGSHYVFPSHTQDRKKNPLHHEEKVGAMKKMFSGANIASHKGIHTAIDAMKHLEKKGHTHVTMVVGDDRVGDFHKLLHKYNGKEYNFKKIEVKSAGHRDPDAEGAEGMSASKLRNLVTSGKRDEFISHYSDKKLGAHLHDRIKKTMSESTKSAMVIIGAPGSGKDYVINNILSRFDLVEVQLDQILVGSVKELLESESNLLINAPADLDKINLVKNTLGEDYDFSYTLVSVSNKVSRERNLERSKPMNESTRIKKWLEAERASRIFEDTFVFDNSINLQEASSEELSGFQVQIASYLQFLLDRGLTMEEVKKPTGKLKDACWKGYTAVGMKMKNGRKVPNCVPVKEEDTIKPAVLDTKPRKKGKSVPANNMNMRIDGAGGYSLGGLTQTEGTGVKKFSEFINEAEYQGREVPLNKPMKGDVKKSKVFVKDPETGNVKKVNFGDKKLSIKKHIASRKKSYCARSSGQGNTTDKTKANYWSRRAWDC
jgi:dephospho-CoA kinase